MDKHSNAKKTAPPLEVLQNLYEVERLSLAEAGRRLGVSVTVFHRWLRETDGIRPRTVSEARKVAKKHVYSEETLERMRARAARMRENCGPESHRKQSEAMRGKLPPNAGKPMSEAQRQLLIVQRADPQYRQIQRERFSGERNWNWKGGVKSELNRRLDTAEWRRIRQEVYARDNWLCQDCGVKCKNSRDSKFLNQHKRKIQAHHIVARRDGGGDELSNLTTLCMACHHKRERAEKESTGRPGS